SRLHETAGESTFWYASFWEFCSAYLNKRFGDKWCLSPEQSLSLHSGNCSIPAQLLVRSPKGTNNIIQLPYQTSLFDVRYALPEKHERLIKNNLRIHSLPSALVACSSRFFIQNATDARTALSLVKDVSDILKILLSK